jgi:putative copper export protein
MFWTIMLFLHVIAMAYFLGGQMMLAANVVPVLIKGEDGSQIAAVARRFGIGSLVALAVLVLTGMGMASHFDLWGVSQFQVKMGLVLATIVSVTIHMSRSNSHALMGLTFLLTLATVYAGIHLTTPLY